MTALIRLLSRAWLAALLFAAPLPAPAQGEPIGIVIMHGKGGSPTGFVAGLARTLESAGYLVANLEMPWSGRRNYDVPVGRAEEEVEAAVESLRGKGAKKVFVAGHSQGGVFALHLAGKLPVDGFIAISPGGNVASRIFRDKLGDSLARARQLVAEGKGAEPARLNDFEGSRGVYPVAAVPAAYVSWFDPEGAMSMDRAVRAASPGVPILWLVGTRDYPVVRNSIAEFRTLPSHPRNRFNELDADHRGTPSAAAEEIARWTKEVAGAAKS